MMERILKIIFNKSGGTSGKGGITTRLTIPKSWIDEMGITQEDRDVKASFENGKIIIEKVKPSI